MGQVHMTHTRDQVSGQSKAEASRQSKTAGQSMPVSARGASNSLAEPPFAQVPEACKLDQRLEAV